MATSTRRLIYLSQHADASVLAALSERGWTVDVAESGRNAVRAARSTPMAAGLLDLADGSQPHDIAGVESALARPSVCWIAIVAPGQIEEPSLRRLVRDYCFDYFTIPVDPARVASAVGHAWGMAFLTDAVTGSLSNSATPASEGEMVGSCEAMIALFRSIRKVATTDAPVFISGESGTGKELTAVAIHERSRRREKPCVAINCGAIPPHLMQSELFGYEKGAFTGASQRKIGRVEAANGGTLFLDEIGDLPLESQASLLRFLQEQKVERLGSKPNLKQMHHDARQNVSASLVDEVLEKEIRGASKLTEGARGAGAKVNLLPARPADIEDDGEFHYAVLGPKAASNGKPSAEARRFIDETTGPDKPRAQNRNAVVLAVPSGDGIEVAREKVRDLLGWEKVREMLKERTDIDTAATTRLEGNLRAARGEMVSQIVMAYCIAVTVNDSNDVAAYRINVDNDPLFAKMAADKRLRIESTAVNAEALLPGGPFDLWAAGDKARFVKDLVGAFAATARLPKMLNRSAILETLLQGCEAGDFVLRVTRADKSVRTFWKSRPDDTATQDSSLEVALSDAAALMELDAALLAPGILNGLWKTDAITLADISEYFSGKHFVEVDKGGYTENVLIPAAEPLAIAAAVAGAVKSNRVWLVNGTISVLGEDVPAGFVSESAQLLAPPPTFSSVDLLQDQLPAAWSGGQSTVHLIHGALSANFGKPLPWARTFQALDEAFRLGLIERTLDSASWPCDMGGASAIKIRVSKNGVKPPSLPKLNGSKAASADLQTHEVQDLADNIDALREATAGQALRIRVTVEIGDGSQVEQSVIDKVNVVLAQIKVGWMAE
ncbi:sigma-54 interacting transcriptional regulator [Paraburkholderia sp. BL21I4N1]|nr:sigma-54 interacting transcriptional regulator [Paraburkholderia sp. BL21I4N1]